MSHTGSCMCGAVRFTISVPVTETAACHCSMCRKWSGGVYMAVQLPADSVEIEGADAIRFFASSPWAERAFCGTCGSNLFYRVTAEGPMQGEIHMGLGVLDDPSGVALTTELFIDLKPEAYGFAQKTHQMTEADVMEMFAPPS